MKNKQLLTIAFITIFGIVVSAPTSWARSPQSYRLEGVAIGLGAVILGKALWDLNHQPAVAPVPRPVVVEHRYRQIRPEPAGYWETRKEWIPAKYHKVWHPGQYNSHGRWLQGHWKQVQVQPGHWIVKQVWVPYD